MKVNLTVIILTYNEEINIHYSINNVIGWANQVIVLDSNSTDQTVQIAENSGAKVYFRRFDNYAKQRSYAINELPVNNEWILFLDADEWLTTELKKEISEIIPQANNDGFLIKRRFYFMGRWIKYGGYYPSWNLRLFRKGKASINREINEHIEVDGKVASLKYDMVDENHKDFSHWIQKHNKYSDFEAMELFRKQDDSMAKFWGGPIQRKRWIRQNIWNRMLPPLIRPFIYFIYRYFFRFGFLDGKQGFIYHFMHGLVYRLIIDTKFIELKKKNKIQSN